MEKDKHGNSIEDIQCIVEDVMALIEKQNITSFWELIEYYNRNIEKLEKEKDNEVQEMNLINRYTEYDYIFNNPSFFANLFK